MLPNSTTVCSKTLYVSTENLLSDFLGVIPYKENVQVKGIAFVKGDTLLSNIRPYLKKAIIATFNGCCSADVVCFRSSNVLPEYLYYVIANTKFINYVMESCKGSKMPRGDKAWMLQKPIYVPDIESQRKTAKFLALLDKRIETQNKIIGE